MRESLGRNEPPLSRASSPRRRSSLERLSIRIDYADVWNQVWLIYFLRNRRLAVPNPTIYLNDVEYKDNQPIRFDAAASYAIGPRPLGPVLWSQNGVYLYKLG